MILKFWWAKTWLLYLHLGDNDWSLFKGEQHVCWLQCGKFVSLYLVFMPALRKKYNNNNNSSHQFCYLKSICWLISNNFSLNKREYTHLTWNWISQMLNLAYQDPKGVFFLVFDFHYYCFVRNWVQISVSQCLSHIFCLRIRIRILYFILVDLMIECL